MSDALAVMVDGGAFDDVADGSGALGAVPLEAERRPDHVQPPCRDAIMAPVRSAFIGPLKGVPSLLERGRKARNQNLVLEARAATAPVNLADNKAGAAP